MDEILQIIAELGGIFKDKSFEVVLCGVEGVDSYGFCGRSDGKEELDFVVGDVFAENLVEFFCLGSEFCHLATDEDGSCVRLLSGDFLEAVEGVFH